MLHSVHLVHFSDFAVALKEEAEVWIRMYHGYRFLNPKILESLHQNFDMENMYGLGSVTHVISRNATNQEHRKTKPKMWLKEWGLKSTQAQARTFEMVARLIQEIRKQFPTAGAESMRAHLCLKKNMQVPRCAFVPTLHYSLTDIG